MSVGNHGGHGEAARVPIGVVAALRETAAGESRVAITPETVKRFREIGAQVMVEEGAGLGASISDDEFVLAGATICKVDSALAAADVLLTVKGHAPDHLRGARPGAALIGNLDARSDVGRLAGYRSLGLECLAMELLPRITRAQAMDTLSSQSNLSGYRAVILAANEFGRAFPMMMTAAGTIAATRLFVMGAGVAGLQAIATARRLGAQVSATDVRNAAREQILSLGAKPVFPDGPDASGPEGSGGYAGEMSDQYRVVQEALVSAHLEKQDVVITTALVAGLHAPRLINDAQLARMRPGSIVIDLAIERGGNVEGSVADERVQRHGVTILAPRNLLSSVSADASALFARNLYNFVSAYWSREDGCLRLPQGDDIIDAIRVSSGDAAQAPGTVRNEIANEEMENA